MYSLVSNGGDCVTEDGALALYAFLKQRIFGWNTVLAANNPLGKLDFRTRQSRRCSNLLKDLLLNEPPFEKVLKALQNDEDPAGLWPEAMSQVIRFRLWHIVPRAANEPLSEEGQERRRATGMSPWPDFLWQYSRPATLRDHPEFPELSTAFLEISRVAKRA
jgi:hypothetical protein